MLFGRRASPPLARVFGHPLSPAAAIVALAVAVTVLRLLLARLVGLSVDECYAVVMGRILSSGYFDHPPLTFWLAGLAARLFGTEAPVAVRLPFVLLAAATTFACYGIGARLFNPRAGLWGAVLLNLSLFYGPCGGWILPDGPLACFVLLAAFCLTHALWGPPARARAWWWAFSLAAGLALLSKYHTVFLFAGVAAFLLTSSAHRRWIARPEPWLAAVTSAVLFSPVLLWNAFNGWASFRFQGGRASALDPGGGSPLLDSLGGSALWMTPLIWIGLLWVLGSALATGPRDDRRWFLACLAVGPIAVFTALTAFGTRGLAHWSAPGYLFAFPLLGAAVEQRLTRRWMRASLVTAAVCSIAITTLLTVHARVGLPLPAQMLTDGDPTHDLLAWNEVAAALLPLRAAHVEAAVVGRRWVDAAKIAYALGPDVPVTAVGDDPRGFRFVMDQKQLIGRNLLLVTRRHRRMSEAMVAYAPYCGRIRPLESVPLRRGGRTEMLVSLYLCERFLAPFPQRTGPL
jgi:4-amino-4-deoxy-L-arabinose transferase-like glycosyltransferase